MAADDRRDITQQETPDLSEKVAHARKALQCLHIAVEPSVADDVGHKVIAAFIAYEAEIARLRDGWREARKRDEVK